MLVALLGIGIAVLLLQVATAAVAEIRFREVKRSIDRMREGSEADETD